MVKGGGAVARGVNISYFWFDVNNKVFFDITPSG
jgi:hypothetical protein